MLKRHYRRTQDTVCHLAERSLDLCKDIDNDEPFDQAELVREALARTVQAQRIIAIGEHGVGKSSLLSGLIEEPSIKAVGFETPCLCWRFLRSEDELPSRYLPNDRLDGLELVDTFGSGNEQAAYSIAALLPTADVVIAVFSGDNIWSAPTWELLGKMPEDAPGIRLIALTHCERYMPDKVMAIKEQARELSRQYLGTELPLYQVSPGANIQGTGLDVFAERIQDALDSADTLQRRITEVYQATVLLMDAQASVLRTRERITRGDSGFLLSIDHEIDNFQNSQEDGIPSQIQSIGHLIQQHVPGLIRNLSRHLGIFITPAGMMNLRRTGEMADRDFFDVLSDEIEKRQEAQDRAFIFACQEHWASVRPRMKQKLDSEIGEFPMVEFQEDLARLRTELRRALYKPINKFGLKTFLVKLCNQQEPWMRRTIYFALLFVIISGTLGSFGQNFFALVSLCLAAGIWFVGSLALLLEKRRIGKRIQTLTEDLPRAINEGLQLPVRQLLVSRVASYRRLYTKPRLKVSRNAEQLAPLVARHSELYKALRSVGYHL